MTNNRLIGGVRFRQLRAAPNKHCRVPDDLKSISDVCYAYGYSSWNRDTAPFGPEDDPYKYTFIFNTFHLFLWKLIIYY